MPLPTSEQDAQKLRDLLKDKQEGVRSSQLLMSNFKTKHNGLTRLIKAIRTIKANVEIYPSSHGHNTMKVFHPDIQPHEDEHLTSHKDTFEAYQNGEPVASIASRHKITQQAVSKRINSHLKRERLKKLILDPNESIEETQQENYKMQAAKYAIEQPTRAHPSIAGFELETYLRHLANKHQNDEYVPLLVHSALTGGDHPEGQYDPSALLPLNDRLQEIGEPVQDYYDLPKATAGLHLDNATNHIINHMAHDLQMYHLLRPSALGEEGQLFQPAYYPELHEENEVVAHAHRTENTNQLAHNRRRAIEVLRAHLDGHRVSPYWDSGLEGLQILLDQGHDPKDLYASLRRHEYRNMTNTHPPHPALEQGALLPATNDYIKGRRYKAFKQLLLKYLKQNKSDPFLASIPLKYRNHPAVSSFIQAIRQLRSRNQEVRREVPAVQYQKIAKLYPNAKIELQHILDSVADTPQSSAAGTAHIVTHENGRDPLMAAVALIAHQLNTSYLAMHEDDNGPDSLYQFDISGGADQFRKALDGANLDSRNFIKKPDNTGWWPVLYDKGNKLKQQIEAFATANRVMPKVTRGHGEFIGQMQGAEMESDPRNDLLGQINKFQQTGVFPTKQRN